MAELIRYVDTDVSGGLGDGSSWANAHPTLVDWESDNQQNLTDGDGDWMHAYVRGNAQDTTEVKIDGWSTGSATYILIEGSSDSTGKHSGVWDDSKYSLVTNATYFSLGIYESYVRVASIQIKTTSAKSSIYVTGSTGVLLKALISVNTSADWHSAVLLDSSSSVTAENCIFYHLGADYYSDGVSVTATSTINLYNCLVSHYYYGLRNASGCTLNAYNSLIFDNSDDFEGTITCDYCASDDANASTYTNGVDFTSEATDWGNIFENYSTGDFRLKNYTGDRCIIDKGTSKSYGDPDIAGVSRGATWDIGPFEAAGKATKNTRGWPLGVNAGLGHRMHGSMGGAN